VAKLWHNYIFLAKVTHNFIFLAKLHIIPCFRQNFI
jgi:hypothetical protein